jgi:alpha-N-arabinofuranosidase
MRSPASRLAAILALALTLLGCGAALESSQSSAPADGNLIVNSSFEQRDGDKPRGWTFESRASQKGKWSAVRDRAHTGEYTLKLEPNDKNRPWDIASHPLSVGQAFPAGPYRGKTLYISAWLGSEGPAVAVAGLFALRSDGGVGFARLAEDSSRPGLTFHQDRLVVPDDAKVQYVIVNLAAEGTAGAAYFDDVSLSLTPPGKSPADESAPTTQPQTAEIAIDAAREIRRVPRTVYGSNIEWVWNGNGVWSADTKGLQPEILRLTRDAGFSLLRFPGGVFADFYHWRNGVGPESSRRQTEHSPGGPRSVHVFGTDEALAFAKATGSELLITVNAGSGSASEAADWVRYVNKEHVDGGGVKYWEIGNELYIKDPKFVSIEPSEYAKRVIDFAQAMRAVDPTIKIAAIADDNYPSTVHPAYAGWTDEVLRRAARQIDFLAVHDAYAPMLIADEGIDVRTAYAAMLAAPVLIKRNIAAVQQKLEAVTSDGSPRLKLAVTEWGPFFHFDLKNRFVDHVKTLGSALYVASVLKVFVESPSVEIANAFKLVDPLFMGWIGLRDGHYVPTAPYFAVQLFTRHFGERVVASTTTSPGYDSPAAGWVDRISNVPYLDLVASRSEDGRKLYVIAINKHFDLAITGRIILRGFTPAGRATAWVLNGTGIDAHTGTRPVPAAASQLGRQASAPDGRFDRSGAGDVTLTSTPVDKISSRFEYVFPAHSVTSLEIEGRL